MNGSENKEVRFDIYCETCKYGGKRAVEDPCNECLAVGMREGTFIPEKWEAEK